MGAEDRLGGAVDVAGGLELEGLLELGVQGSRGLVRLLREVDAGRLIALEEALSQNESLIDRARHFLAVCQID